MCLAVPARLVTLDGTEGVVDLHGNRVPVCALLTPEVGVGDWVLVHAGFVMQRIDEQQARATWSVLDEVERIDGVQRESQPTTGIGRIGNRDGGGPAGEGGNHGRPPT